MKIKLVENGKLTFIRQCLCTRFMPLRGDWQDSACMLESSVKADTPTRFPKCTEVTQPPCRHGHCERTAEEEKCFFSITSLL